MLASLGNVKKTVYLVGKGISYDTGGADIKAGGIMAGMSRYVSRRGKLGSFAQKIKSEYRCYRETIKIFLNLCLS